MGLVMYKEPVDQSSKYDAYCYRLKGTVSVLRQSTVGPADRSGKILDISVPQLTQFVFKIAVCVNVSYDVLSFMLLT